MKMIHSVIALSLLPFSFGSVQAEEAPRMWSLLSKCTAVTATNEAPRELEIYADVAALTDPLTGEFRSFEGATIPGMMTILIKNPGDGPAIFKMMVSATLEFKTQQVFTASALYSGYSLSVAESGEVSTLSRTDAADAQYVCAYPQQ